MNSGWRMCGAWRVEAVIVRVKLYASLRRHRPELDLGQAFDCRLPDSATVGQLITEALNLADAEVAIILVNGLPAARTWALRDSDRVSLWPPVAGG